MSHRVRKGRSPTQSTATGYMNELLAAADINHRCEQHGGFAYLNPAPQTKDDIFGKTSLGWKTFQVKTAQLYITKTGVGLSPHNCKKVTSDVLVLVDDLYMRVRYIAKRGELPPELPTIPTAICQGVVVFNPGVGGESYQSSSSTARVAKRK